MSSKTEMDWTGRSVYSRLARLEMWLYCVSLLHAAGVKKGDEEVHHRWNPNIREIEGLPASGPSTARDMVFEAFRNKQAAVHSLILETCPKMTIYDSLLKAAFRNSDLETFKVLQS